MEQPVIEGYVGEYAGGRATNATCRCFFGRARARGGDWAIRLCGEPYLAAGSLHAAQFLVSVGGAGKMTTSIGQFSAKREALFD